LLLESDYDFPPFIPACEEQIIMNTVYAIFDGKTDRMDYKFRT
jgi:hypothetical protein